MDQIGWVLILAGAAIAAFGYWRYRVAVTKSEAAAGSWREVPGTLHEASIDKNVVWGNDNDQTIEYIPIARYSYSVDGREFEGTRPFLSRSKYDSESEGQAWLARTKPGPLSVWHDPADPSQSVLEVDRPGKSGLFVAGVFAAILIGVGISVL